MTDIVHVTQEIFEDSGIHLMARITGQDAANITQADISSIAYAVYDLNVPKTAIASGALVVATVVYNTLQTDSRWRTDSTGYNFRWAAPAALFATGDTQYGAVVRLTPAAGDVFPIEYKIPVRKQFGS